MLGVPESDYGLVAGNDPAFLPGRAADIVLRGKVIGVLGVLHPDVLSAFELFHPTAALELDIEHFL